MIFRGTETGMSMMFRSSHPEVFVGKGVLKTCSKCTGEHPYRSVILVKLLCNFIEITLRHECSPLNLLHIFRTPFPRNTSGRLLLDVQGNNEKIDQPTCLFFFVCFFFHLKLAHDIEI